MAGEREKGEYMRMIEEDLGQDPKALQERLAEFVKEHSEEIAQNIIMTRKANAL